MTPVICHTGEPCLPELKLGRNKSETKNLESTEMQLIEGLVLNAGSITAEKLLSIPQFTEGLSKFLQMLEQHYSLAGITFGICAVSFLTLPLKSSSF